MSELGSFVLNVSVVTAGYAIVAAVLAAVLDEQSLYRSAAGAVYAVFGLLTVATAVLLYALLSRDFQVAYVADYSNRSLPIVYTISALWGGQEGSLLFWAWVLSLFAAVTVAQNRRQNRRMMPYVIAVMGVVQLFFLIVLALVSSPFVLLPSVPVDGRGMNPLLQNPGMLFHPPTLFFGYVGFTVPFAFAVAALITGRTDDAWIRSTRRWTIFSWFFLGVGIVLGAKWAYVELGWGGYWAWDPVENASLMPWLTATAYLHSVMIQERRGMLKVWNMVLIILTFLLCIFGTFMTRSGIISSVHSFGQSSIGSFFLFFLIFALAAVVILLVRRLPSLRSSNELDSLISRESSFLFNNLILVGATFAVFLGTIFPIISEAVRGVKITVGPPFFNKVLVPIGIVLLLLTGICPLIAWRKASVRNFTRNLLAPAVVALGGGVTLLLAGVRHFYALLTFTISIFVVATIVAEVVRGVRARHTLKSEPYLTALRKLFFGNKRRYGGYIIHLGVVLIFIGISGSSAFKTSTEAFLRQGEEIRLQDYTIRFERLAQYPTAHKTVTSATLSISRGGKTLGYLNPAIENYEHDTTQTASEVDIRSTLAEDLYAILAGYDMEKSTAVIKLLINPLVAWMWIGSLVLVGGTALVMLPDRRKRGSRRVRSLREAVAR